MQNSKVKSSEAIDQSAGQVQAGRAAASAAGVAAILFWSTTVAVGRHLTERLGTMTAALCVYALAGLGGAVLMAANRGALRRIAALPRRYLFGCGGLFVAYTVLIYLAIGGAADRRVAVEVGIVNYLWPSLTVLFSVPLLGLRWRAWLLPGIVLALAGVVVSEVQPGQLSWTELADSVRANGWPFAFALIASVCWALYSGLTRRWAGPRGAGAVPVFMVASAAALGICRLAVRESAHWSAATAGELAYMGLGPVLIGYLLWDLAMRRGHVTLVASLSNFIPLLSTLFSCLLLGVAMGPTLWLASGLLVAGAILCNWSVGEPETKKP